MGNAPGALVRAKASTVAVSDIAEGGARTGDLSETSAARPKEGAAARNARTVFAAPATAGGK
jgi:hypothetical protein